MSETNERCASCSYKQGPLPACAPLAAGFVPVQQSAMPQYERERALARGTLFPGLDLPLANVVNSGTAPCNAKELMAVDFAAHEIALYLDTHPNDTEAFAAYRELLALAEEARADFERKHGAVCKSSLRTAETYNWTATAFPWVKED